MHWRTFIEVFAFKHRAVKHQLVRTFKRWSADEPNRIVRYDVELGRCAVVFAR